MPFRRPIVSAALLALAVLFVPSRHSLAQKPAQHTAGKELRVAAAADLEPVLPALAELYRQATGVKLVISYGSSGTLTTQILNGAPVDLFLAADFTFPERIVAAGLTEDRAPIPYARGSLVLFTRKDSPLQPLSMERLTDPRVRTVAIADPSHAPYGRAAVAALQQLKLLDTVQPHIVTAENVAQAGQFAVSGNAQLAFVSLTLAISSKYKEIGTYVMAPTVYPEIRQCAVVLKRSDRRPEAQAFLAWLLSSPVQEHLPEFGLRPIR